MKVTGFMFIAIYLYSEATSSLRGQMEYDLLLIFAEIAQNFVIISDSADNKVTQDALTTLTGSWRVTTLVHVRADKILQSGSTDPCFLIRGSFEVLVLTATEEVTSVIEMIMDCSKMRSSWRPIIVLFWPEFHISLGSLGNSSILAAIISLVHLQDSLFILLRNEDAALETQTTGPDHNHGGFPVALFEAYSIHNESFVKIVAPTPNQSSWPNKAELSAALRSAVYHRDFAGAPVSGIFANYPGFEIESELKTINGSLKLVGGLSVQVFLELAYTFNFTPIPVQGSGWMWKDYATGEWQGSGGQVMRGEGDVGASVTVLTDDRVDFELLPPVSTRHVFAFFVQPPLSDLRDIFEQPFDFRLFWGAAGLYIMTFLIMTSVSWLTRKYGQILSKMDVDLEFRRNIGFILITTVCLKNWYRTPDSYRLRWIFFCSALFSSILYTAFSAALVSTLSSETLPIKTMTDLLSSGMLIAGDSYITYVVTTLETVHGTEDHEEIKKRGAMFGLAQAPPLVRQRKLAFLALMDEFIAAFKSSNFNDTDYCRYISSVEVTTLPTPVGMLMRKDSPFVEHFKYGTIKLMERGVSHRRIRDYKIDSEIQCRRDERQFRKGLRIADVLTAYVILALGTLTGLVFALIEKTFHSFSRTRRLEQFENPIFVSSVAAHTAFSTLNKC